MKTSILMTILVIVISACSSNRQFSKCPDFKQSQPLSFKIKKQKKNRKIKREIGLIKPHKNETTIIDAPRTIRAISFKGASLNSNLRIKSEVSAILQTPPSIRQSPLISNVSSPIEQIELSNNRSIKALKKVVIKKQERFLLSSKSLNSLGQKKRTLEQSSQSVESKGKSQVVALLLALFLGLLGIHRFYLGYVGIGIIQLLTLGGLGIWTFIDFVLIQTGVIQPKEGPYEEEL